MPIEVGIWRLGDTLERIRMSALDSEAKLEKTLEADLSILRAELLLLGRQVPTAFGKFIDLLAIDQTGNLIVIELKKSRTPRDVVAQLLDYGSWVQSLSYEQVATIYSESHSGQKFEVGFADQFGTNPPEAINQSHELVLVSSELDSSTERIIDYLTSSYGVPINAVFFRYFQDGDREYLARTWLIDPEEVEAKTVKSGAKKGVETWNGRDFYVSLGEGDGDGRNWDDCRRFEFISGGGGRWYSQTLAMLFVGARVFVNIPKTGYTGVGIVTQSVVPVSDYRVTVDGTEMPLLAAPLQATRMGVNASNPDLSEYVVGVKWLKAVPRGEAYWEKGLFAIQHTACRLRNKFTIERLCQHFGIDE